MHLPSVFVCVRVSSFPSMRSLSVAFSKFSVVPVFTWQPFSTIFAGLPVQGSDTGDYLVRNLMAIDPRQGWVVLGAEVAPGDQILFCRRDPESARTDMSRMLRQLAGRLPGR